MLAFTLKVGASEIKAILVPRPVMQKRAHWGRTSEFAAALQALFARWQLESRAASRTTDTPCLRAACRTREPFVYHARLDVMNTLCRWATLLRAGYRAANR